MGLSGMGCATCRVLVLVDVQDTDSRSLLLSVPDALRMKESLMDVLCCPMDKAELELSVEERADDDDEVITGTLECTECGETYPIEDGIPNLLPPDMRDDVPA